MGNLFFKPANEKKSLDAHATQVKRFPQNDDLKMGNVSNIPMPAVDVLDAMFERFIVHWREGRMLIL